jgi:hypothetical protein
MGQRSPNEDLSLIDQALCVARALLALEPVGFDEVLEIISEQRRYEAEHGQILGQWIRGEFPNGREWYVLTTADGRGESREKPPPGEEIAVTLTLPSKRPTFSWLKELAEGYKTGSIRFGGREPTLNDLSRLALAIRACSPGYNERFMSSFEEDLQKEWQSPEDSPKSREEDSLDQFAKWLSSLRGDFGADTPFFAGFTTAVEICYRITSAGSDPTQRRKTYIRYAEKIMNSRPDPQWLLQMVAWEAMRDSYGGQVLGVADQMRDLTDQWLKAALNAPTLNGHLDGLYRAIPPAWAARQIYTVAGEYRGSNPPTSNQRERFLRIGSFIDERLTRLMAPLTGQIMDLDRGNEWRRHREIVRRARNQDGESAAAAAARSLIEGQYLYPRALHAMLLEQH